MYYKYYTVRHYGCQRGKSETQSGPSESISNRPNGGYKIEASQKVAVKPLNRKLEFACPDLIDRP
jgi:hypothetical protein